MHVVGKIWQLLEFFFVVGEILLVLHVVDVCVLNVLHNKRKKTQSIKPSGGNNCDLF